MPYERKAKCVYRKDTGKKVGCSKSASRAKKYLKKLYTVEDEERPSFEKYFKRVDDSIQYDPEELKKGIKVEHEHTTDSQIAEIIAKQHLAEDPKYYSKLEKMHKD
jgi:hypothetical protein